LVARDFFKERERERERARQTGALHKPPQIHSPLQPPPLSPFAPTTLRKKFFRSATFFMFQKYKRKYVDRRDNETPQTVFKVIVSQVTKPLFSVKISSLHLPEFKMINYIYLSPIQRCFLFCVSSCLCIYLGFGTRCAKCEKRKNVHRWPQSVRSHSWKRCVAHPTESERKRGPEFVGEARERKREWPHGPAVFFVVSQNQWKGGERERERRSGLGRRGKEGRREIYATKRAL